MDAPGETLLDSSGDTGHERNGLPELSRSQSTLSTADSYSYGPPIPIPIPSPPAPVPVPVSSVPGPPLRKQKSMRTRPAEVLERQHAAPPSPLRDRPSTASQQPKPKPKVSKMSLFNLFSRPKVEKLRGWAEPGLEPPSRALSNSNAAPSKPDIVVRVADADAQNGRVRPMTSRSNTQRGLRAMPSKETLSPTLTPDRRALDLPPLFQVWPQATKHGNFEVTTVAAEMVLQKSKNVMVGSSLLVPGSDMQSLRVVGNRESIESRTAVKSALRHVANGSIPGNNLPTKTFVLTTSGYLLQYSETGPSERFPERVLQLGRNSAAYASDLIPGKHHVLQIEQAIDQDGTVVTNPHSFLSKLGLRSQNARRMTSNFLVVMPGPREMEDWMTTIRQEIERLGGKRARSDSAASRAARPRTGETPKIDLRKMPSLSHRYQIKRSPSIPTIPSPSTEADERFPQVQPTPVEEESAQSETSKNEHAQQDEPMFARNNATRPRKTSDVPSISSSTGVSVDQQKLDKLRDSSRISHSTVATTVASNASRTNSMSSTPPAELKDLSESQQEPPTKSPYRSLSSYSLATKRRSATPLSLSEQPLPEMGIPVRVLDHHKNALMEVSVDSPILGRHPTLPEPSLHQPKKSLSEARSVPNLRTVDADQHDSKIPMPPVADPTKRPESFVGDLPDPTTWTSKSAPSHRAPLAHGHFNPEALAQRPAMPIAQRSSMTRPLKGGSHSFSLPLRVNPQDPSSQRPVIKRAPQSHDSDVGVRSPIPAATTLVAKVDFITRTAIDACNIPKRLSSTNPYASNETSDTGRPLTRGSNARLSLFPNAITPPGPPPAFPLPAPPVGRSPSIHGTGLAAHPPTSGSALRRPTSIQVRADHAPFLSSIRVSPVPGQGNQFRATTTVPIRSLKPSRSLATMQTVHQGTPLGPQSFDFGTNADKLSSSGEALDEATPLPLRTESPFRDPSGIPLPSSRPTSRARKCRTSASLPELDFGLPLVGLGPPAPPPQAPLPQLPTGSRPGSRTERPFMRTGTPIGVAIGEVADEESVSGGVAIGLGIEVN